MAKDTEDSSRKRKRVVSDCILKNNAKVIDKQASTVRFIFTLMFSFLDPKTKQYTFLNNI